MAEKKNRKTFQLTTYGDLPERMALKIAPLILELMDILGKYGFDAVEITREIRRKTASSGSQDQTWSLDFSESSRRKKA